MSADNGKRDPFDVLIFLLFWFRVSALAAFGAGFAWLGLRGLALIIAPWELGSCFWPLLATFAGTPVNET